MPCSRRQLNELAETFGVKIEDAALLDFQSALPEFYRTDFGSMKNINELNDLAYEVSKLSGNDFVKLKAIMNDVLFYGIPDMIDCVGRISEYRFDRNVTDYSSFGREYMIKNLPAYFNLSVLENIDLSEFGKKILSQKGGSVTPYGVISGQGQQLYTAISVQPEQSVDEDIEEEETADLEIEMGMM